MSPYLNRSSILCTLGLTMGLGAVAVAAFLFHISSETRTPLLFLLPAGGLFLGGVVLVVFATVIFLVSMQD